MQRDMLFGDMRSAVSQLKQSPHHIDEVMWLLLHHQGSSYAPQLLHYVREHTQNINILHLNLFDLVTWVVEGAASLCAYMERALPSFERVRQVVHIMLSGWSWAVVRNVQFFPQGSQLNPNALYMHPDHTVIYMHHDRHLSQVSNAQVDVLVGPGVHVWINQSDHPSERLKWPGLPEHLGHEAQLDSI